MSGHSSPHSINRTFTHVGTDGVTRTWPDRGDYADWFVHTGQLTQPEDLESAYRVHGRLFLDWVGRNQTACRFATRLARHFDAAGWTSIVISDNVPDDELWVVVSDLLATEVGRSEIVQLLFPHVTSPESLGALVTNLCTPDDSPWYWESMPCESGEWVNVGLRWILPSDTHVAWTVGFGPFDFLPVTRRAPLTAIVVRTSYTKRAQNDPDERGRMPVHLADIDDRVSDPVVRERLTEATKQGKEHLVPEGERESARARVTMRLPIAVIGPPAP